jgi:CMP-N-acetylneuraminic acid synthetase
VHHLDDDRLRQYRPNSIYRRQDLEPLYYHDGAVAAVTRSSLFSRRAQSDPQGFWGADCRAIVQEPTDTVDIDELADFYYAEALLRLRSEQLFTPRPKAAAGERGILTGAAVYARHARR